MADGDPCSGPARAEPPAGPNQALSGLRRGLGLAHGLCIVALGPLFLFLGPGAINLAAVAVFSAPHWLGVASLRGGRTTHSAYLGMAASWLWIGWGLVQLFFASRTIPEAWLLAPLLGSQLALAIVANGYVSRLPKQPSRWWLALFVALVVGFIFVALAQNMRHPPAWEARAISRLRTLIMAQMIYASANQGFYDVDACLLEPWGCIPGYPETSPAMIGEADAAAPQGAYVFEFYPGPRPAGGEGQPISPSSVTSFAYIARPTEGGVGRTLCGDATGAIRFVVDVPMTVPLGGACSVELRELD